MTVEQSNAADRVNPHYLDHVVAISESHGVEASEDIVTVNGLKLLASGAHVDVNVRDRLLQHKLLKPLEDCLCAVDGIIPERFGPIAEGLLEQYPLLRAACSATNAQPIPASLSRLTLSIPVQSLLTVYCACEESRLTHAVGVATLAFALARKLFPGEIDRQRAIALAGLLHDVGELYIDPKYLRRGSPLGPQAWSHIATHPIIGQRVLRDMVGAGPTIAELVMNHHERLDGFGYPRGIGGDALSLGCQILAAAEWQMGMLESGNVPLLRSSIAARFIPGEFSQAVLQVLGAAGREAASATAGPAAASAPLEDAVPRVVRIAATLRRFRKEQDWILEQSGGASPALKSTIELGLIRMQQIQKAFSATGLDAENPEQLLRELAALQDGAVNSEVLAALRELEWRLRETERAQRLRAGLLPADESAIVGSVIDRLKGLEAEHASAIP